jgi:hypothetical protein
MFPPGVAPVMTRRAVPELTGVLMRRGPFDFGEYLE